MHLIKWTRKNMQKIMVFVIIFCMVSFVVGQIGLKWMVSLFGGNNQLIATYDDGQKIKSPDFIRSQNELTVLRMLMADRFLMAQSQGGLSGPLLMHLLFPESQLSAMIPAQMKQAVERGQLPITKDELDKYFKQNPERPEILWLLLKNEAYQAGCIVSSDRAAQTLRYIVPQMTSNQIDAAGLVNQIITKNNIAETQVLRIFSDLMSVMAYSQKVIDNQAVTINQIKASVGRTKERIDVEYVKIEADPLINEDADISDAQIQGQFEKYKTTFPNNPTDDNPFAFGYKLQKQVQLEYMVVLMDDISKQIEKPAAETLEEYYSNNITKFQTTKPVDPNDPDSEKITETRSFAEVEPQIRQMIEQEKTLTQANIIFNDIKDETESGFETLNFDEASAAQLQKAAGEYVVVAKNLSDKYNLPITSGKTGWLDAATFGQSKILSNMGVRRGQNYLRLSDLAFAATEDKKERSRIGIPSVRVWENLGPLNGGYYSEEDQKFYRLMALVRVIGIKDAAVPENVNVTFDTKGIVLGKQTAEEDTTFSLVEQIKQDIRVQAAMSAAKARANEFVSLINKQNWPEAVKAYNAEYAKDTEADDTNSQKIEMRGFKQRLRISQTDIDQIKRMMQVNPGSAQYLQKRIIDNMLTNRFYSLLPEDAKTTGNIQTVLPFEPERAYYVVKEVVRYPATMTDYLDNKAQTALQLSAEESTGLALIHFSPENILQRSGYQSEQKQKSDEQKEEETPAENKEK